jgi:hypothetical protein
MSRARRVSHVASIRVACSDAAVALEYDVIAFAGHSEYWSAEMYGMIDPTYSD